MNVAELARIDREIEIAAPPERVYRALTDAAELGAWFQVKIEGQIAQGATLWMTTTHEGYAGQRFNVEIVEMTPPERFAWKWNPGEVEPNFDYSKEAKTLVTFTLAPSPKGTQLKVAETGFDEISLARRAKVYQSNSQGWAEVLVWLQKYAEASR